MCLWWGFSFKGGEFGIFIQQMHKVVLNRVGDLWNNDLNYFHSWLGGDRERFQMEEGDLGIQSIMMENIISNWVKELMNPMQEIEDGIWVGIHGNFEIDLVGVFCIKKKFNLSWNLAFKPKSTSPKGLKFTMLDPKSRLLQLVKGKRILMSSLTRIRVYAWLGLGGKPFKLFYGL